VNGNQQNEGNGAVDPSHADGGILINNALVDGGRVSSTRADLAADRQLSATE
jgi:hypothetical protein